MAIISEHRSNFEYLVTTLIEGNIFEWDLQPQSKQNPEAQMYIF